ncbi:MAG: BON domain-containing protein [Acidobacteria bacterium]|nr:BON domain-containing protein [Acidobacteriota bacterium]
MYFFQRVLPSLLTLLIGVSFSLAGQSEYPSRATRLSDRPSATDRRSRAEARLIREVRHELVTLPRYGVFDNLAFRVNGNHVILQGQVNTPILKKDAENAVRGIEGVDQVINQIEVLPLSSEDDRIRIATYRAIYGHSTLQRYALLAVPSIHIIVKRGHVVLEGVVDNSGDATIAQMQANGVPGVFSVTSNLRVEK